VKRPTRRGVAISWGRPTRGQSFPRGSHQRSYTQEQRRGVLGAMDLVAKALPRLDRRLTRCAHFEQRGSIGSDEIRSCEADHTQSHG
jgi:hypothetical protein